MNLNGVLKKIENVNREIAYSMIRIFFRNKPQKLPADSSKIKKILIFRYDVIGDFVLSTPCFDLLKKMIPGCEIHVLSSKINSELSIFHPNVDKTFITDGSFNGYIKAIKDMRKENYDMIYAGVFFRTTFAGMLANLIGSKKTIKICIGHQTRNKLYSTFFNVLILPDDKSNINMALLMQKILIDTFGWNMDSALYRTSLGIDKSIIPLVDEKLQSIGHAKKVLFNISARNTWKRDKQLEFTALFKKEFPVHFLVLSSLDRDSVLAAEITRDYGDGILNYRSQSVMELVILISRMDFVISPDTSVPHIAATFNIPVVDIYPRIGTTSIDEWSPYGVDSEIITTEDNQTIDYIEPASVIEGFRKLLERNSG